MQDAGGTRTELPCYAIEMLVNMLIEINSETKLRSAMTQ